MIRFFFLFAFGFVMATILSGCQNENATGTSMSPPGSSQSADHDHDHDEDHDHADEGGHGDEGPMLDLGSAKAGEWTVTASRIEGELNPGGETAIDCSVSGTSGSVSAVRCWIGTKDASGSIKSLAEVEDAAEPAHRHAHVEVPKPLEDGSQLWVEIEDSSGSKHVAGFDLKR